jgi:hypothetical protein
MISSWKSIQQTKKKQVEIIHKLMYIKNKFEVRLII